MLTFSQRIGLRPVRDTIQKASVDNELRNALWNIIYVGYLSEFVGHCVTVMTPNLSGLYRRIWLIHYKGRVDEMELFGSNFLYKIKEDFHNSNWNDTFDFLEFLPNNYRQGILYDNEAKERNDYFISHVNEILTKHLSAYRFVNNLITEITSEEEIASIEDALKDTDLASLKPVHTHLHRALELLVNRQKPDYRNSIKESISSIESLSCIITQNLKATLGQALNEIEKNYELHPALKKSFTSLYGYSSDSEGIRHALLDESTLKQEDAKFMLVACSAFINYLLVKTEKQ